MALTQAQRDAIKAALNLDTLDTYASNPDSLIEQMTPEQLLEGLKCGTLSLEQLNYLFFLGFTATEKSLAESKAYTDGQTTELANKLNFCNALSPRSGNLLQADVQLDGSCKFYYGVEPPADLLNQYVDPSIGVDTNPGTRALPLRTIKKAVGRILGGTYGNIYLQESEVHTVKSSEAWKNANINFYSYGPGCDVLIADNAMRSCNWSFYGAKIAPKARIQFNHTSLTASGKLAGRCIGVGAGNICTFYGIDFNTAFGGTDLYIGSGWEAGLGSNLGGSGDGQTYRFFDCTATINDGYLVAFMENTSVSFTRTQIVKIGNGFAMLNQGNGQIECIANPIGSVCGSYLWNNGINAITLKSDFMSGFPTGTPTYKNVISRTL